MIKIKFYWRIVGGLNPTSCTVLGDCRHLGCKNFAIRPMIVVFALHSIRVLYRGLANTNTKTDEKDNCSINDYS